MSNLLLPRRFYSQPQGAVRIDWSNPISSRVLAAASGYMDFVYVANRVPSTSTSGYGAIDKGVGRVFTKGSLQKIIVDLPKVVSFPFTLFAISTCNIGTTASGIVASVGNGTGSAMLLHAGATSANGPGVGAGIWDGSTYRSRQGTTAYPTGTFSSAAYFPSSSGTYEMSTNGGAFSSGSAGVGGAPNLTGINKFSVGNSTHGTTDDYGGTVVFACVLSGDARDLIKSLHDNPWQIFKVSE